MAFSPRHLSLLLISLGLPMTLSAAVKLNPLFGDHMVLQRDRVLPIWGTADPGEKVSVSFAGATQNVAAAADGRWMAFFDPIPASKIPQNLVVKGANEIKVSDVLVGDVWLGTGQSNMDWSVSATDRKDEIKQAPAGAFDGIRLFKVDQVEIDEPQTEASGQWKLATNDTAFGFSATLFYFGEELHKRMPDVPLGLIRSSVGATNLYCWIPNEIRDKDPSAEFLRTWWVNATKSWSPENQEVRDREVAEYQAKLEEFKQRNEELPADIKKPGELMGPKWSRRPSALFNGMIAPLAPYPLRGMIWYQGEWDSKHDWVRIYHDLFVAFSKGVRGWWVSHGNTNSGDFPIYIVQLPAREPGDGDYWPYMREVQERLATSVPDSGFIVTYDTNDPKDLHPRAKTPVGRRLAYLALSKEYGQEIPWHGPKLTDTKAEAGGLLLSFDAGSDGLKSLDGQALRDFEIAGADGKYAAAEVELRGGKVFVKAASVTNPKTVRFAFAPAPEKPNFVNTADLPAAPFRTDTQPIPGKP